ncbi:nucleotide exchange factor GrpE [Saccharopolyspora hordei]
MWKWRRKDSPESGTDAVPEASHPGEGTSDGEWGTNMTAVTTDPLGQALAERATLIQLCMYALDRARSAGVVERLAEGLSGIGVTLVRPDGDRFDPAIHEAGGTTPTDDPALDGIIAETELVGFSDRDRVLRPPIVTVYQYRRQ